MSTTEEPLLIERRGRLHRMLRRVAVAQDRRAGDVRCSHEDDGTDAQDIRTLARHCLLEMGFAAGDRWRVSVRGHAVLGALGDPDEEHAHGIGSVEVLLDGRIDATYRTGPRWQQSAAGCSFRPQIPPFADDARIVGRVVSFDFKSGTCRVEFPHAALSVGRVVETRDDVELTEGEVVLADGTRIPCSMQVLRGSHTRADGVPRCTVVSPDGAR